MLRRSPVPRRTPLRPGGWLTRTVAMVRRRRDTGPDSHTRTRLTLRSGGLCELPGCGRDATQVHHRLNRKFGGRKGEMAILVNGIAWLLHLCTFCHESVTSAHGRVLVEARVKGWLLLEGETGETVPVLLRHGLVLLDGRGGWSQA